MLLVDALRGTATEQLYRFESCPDYRSRCNSKNDGRVALMDVRTYTLRVELGKTITRGSVNNRDSSERRATFNHIGDINEMVNMANSTPLKINNMKLYTEEQVREAIRMADKHYYLLESEEDGIISLLTPIELPSDEEIGKEMDKLPFRKHIDDGMFNDGQLSGFKLGAKWMRDKILNK